MTIYISENIKQLRREKGLTQEKLADYLGVTFQSISNWERGESLPDISMLPEIAGFFNISVDSLLGMNKALKEKKIKEYLSFYDEMRYADTSLTYKKFQKAIKDFPKDFRILVRYMELLMCENTSEDEASIEKLSHELTSIYENIQNHCTDDSIRMWAKRLLCQHLHTKSHYKASEEYQLQAEKILSEMPDMLNSRDYLSTMLITDKQKHYEACSDAIENILYFLNNTVSHYCFYDESFTVEYKIDAINKVINIINTVFSDGNFGKLWLNMIYNYGHLARLHFENNDYDNALKNLDICVSFAKKYDNLPEASVRTAQFFESRIYEKTHRSRTMCQRIKYLVTEKYPFSEEFKNSQKFKELIKILDE